MILQKVCLSILALVAPAAYAHKGHGFDALPAAWHALIGHGELWGLLAVGMLLMLFITWRSGRLRSIPSNAHADLE